MHSRNLLLLILIFFTLKAQALSNTDSIKRHVEQICRYSVSRSMVNKDVLNEAAQYIMDEFKKRSSNTAYQRYEISEEGYRNVLASFGPPLAPRIVIGAHYDTPLHDNGVNNNGSGVAALLELARLFSLIEKDLTIRIDLVAYDGGELFESTDQNMGSHKHAYSLSTNKLPILGIVLLDELGHYTSEPLTQSYPNIFHKLFRSRTGNFLALVQRIGMGSFGSTFAYFMKQDLLWKVKKFKPLIRLSEFESNDMRNYLSFDYSVLLITDTGPFRNIILNTTFEQPNAINYRQIKAAVDMVYKAVLRYRA